MDLRQLFSCFAVAYLAIAVWGHLPSHWIGEGSRRRSLLGIVMGLGAIATMMTPLRTVPGISVDLRGPLIASAAFVGGPLTAGIAAVLALSYRLALGGLGVWSGCGTILVTAIAGAVGHRLAARHHGAGFATLLLAGAVALFTMLSPSWLPGEFWAGTPSALGPVALLGFACTALFVVSLQRDERMRALLAKDALHRAIIEILPDCLCAKDRQGRFIAANPATARMMNAGSAAELIGKSDADFYPPDMARLFREEELKVLDNVVLGPFDQEVRLSDGSRRWQTSMKTPMLDDKGEVAGIVITCRDVTDRKRLESELFQTQGYLKEAMDNMVDGLVLYDRDRRIRFCNRQFVNMFPVTADLRVEGTAFDDIARASFKRGEVVTTGTVEDYLADRIRYFHHSGESLLGLRDGRTLELRTRVLPGFDVLVLVIDVTAKKQWEQDLLRRASHDPVTGLPNRSAFEFQLDQTYRRATAQSTRFAVMMLDLDRFKPVNDTFGHAVGDKLLVEVAERLREAMSDGTLVARLGGDEFSLLVFADDVETAAVKLAHRIMKNFKQPFWVDDIELSPSASLGIAYFPHDSAEPFELLRLADKALYAVKTNGGGTWAISTAGAKTRDASKALVQSAA